MNKMNWKWTLVCTAALVAATVLLDAVAWAGKPGSDPPPLENPTAIKYQIQFWDVPSGGSGQLNGTNNLGEAVGRYSLPDGTSHAFLYDPSATDPTTAIDLHDAIGSDPALEGWVIASATDINDYGVVVGYLFPDGSPWDPNFRRGYVLNTGASPWTIRLLPDDAWSFSAPRRINENGDIAGLYRKVDQTWGAYFVRALDANVLWLSQNVQQDLHLNNSVGGRAAQVAGLLSDGRPYRWTTGQAPEIISGIASPSVEGLNDSGTICGSTLAKRTRYPMRYSTSLEVLSSVSGWGSCINSAGDLVTNGLSGTRFLYHDYWKFLNIDALIDPTDPSKPIWDTRNVNGFSLVGLSDRIATTANGDATTEFGLVSGTITLADGDGMFFLLTPVKK